MAYAELFCQSNFSFLKGASHPEELVQAAARLGYEALALTDECSVAGVVRAYQAIKQHNLSLRLIIGTLVVIPDELSLLLLCPCREAYSELCRVISNARGRAEKGQYRLHPWDIKSLRHCLVIWLPQGQEQVDQYWGKWLCNHQRARLWLGLSRYLQVNEQDYHQHCLALCAQFQLTLTACGGVLMHSSERLALQHTLTAIRQGKTVDTLGRELLVNAERSLRSLDKLTRLFSQQALLETLSIARRCKFSLSKLRYEYPAELVPSGHNATSYLRELVEAGILTRFGQEPDPDIRATIEKELALIQEQQYEYFFLTIHDLVAFARAQGILYQGRGSAANSVVCYCLQITAVDPRRVDVLFERFISKERNEPPDIDVDFEHQRREEVIQYLYQKYGRQRCALAATVITFRFKSALREVGKALGFAESQLAHWITNVDRRDKQNDWRAQLVEQGVNPSTLKGRLLLERVDEILGFPRHLSQHVGGFVISRGSLYHLVPIENAAMADRTIIQWDKDDLETLALLKVDVLALGMLTAIRRCFGLVEAYSGERLDMAEIATAGDDPKVYQMIQQADTVGVFQIESRAQMNMLPRLRPACYYDLVVQIAIVRPGPVQGDMVHPYLKRRDGREAVSYPSEAVRQVLERTLGVPIFQEQVIKLAMVAAGFSGGEADQLRRAMAAWKRNGELGKFRYKLTEGMRQRGYSEDFAERIYRQICGFADYGFPESHSASFALLAYVSAWLKFYHPAAFYTALLNSLPMGFYSADQLVQDAKRHGLDVRPVCVNHSQWHSSLEHTDSVLAIRLGLDRVKGLQESAAHNILTARPEGGYQQIAQLQGTGVAASQLQALASSGAFSTLQGNRYQTRWALLDNAVSLPLFADTESSAPEANLAAPDLWQDMLEDYQSTGMSLGNHPLLLLARQQRLPARTLAAELHTIRDRSVISIVGLVRGRQRPGTASGVTFMTLEDETGNHNVVVWSATAHQQKQAFLSSRLLQVKGILERGDAGVTHIIAGKLIDLSDLLDALACQSRDFH